MKKLKAYYKLGRPFNALSGGMAVFLGGYVAGTGQWANVFLAALTTFLITASSNAWNDCLDVEIDKVNQPHRVLPAGHLTVREAWNFSLILCILSLLLAFLINLPAFLIALFSNVLLYFYSWRLKSTVLVGNATVAAVSAASVIFGGVAAGNWTPSLPLAVVIANIIMAREILKTMADYEGDLSHHVRTVATVWGTKVATNLFLFIATIAFIMMMVPYLMAQYDLIYVIMIAVGIYPVLFYILTQVRHNTPAAKLERLSQILKYDFLIWFFAVLAGASG